MSSLRNLAALFLLSVCSTAVAFSQQPNACRADIPVGVIAASGDSYRGLSANDFIARASKTAIPIKSVTFDDGPRRVLFVVDTGKKVNSNSRKAEIEMVNAIIAAGRPEDSFALIATHGQNRAAKFGEARTKLTEALGGEWGSKSAQDVGVLDAVMEGIEWFGEPVNGDAIVVLAAELGGNHKANPKIVEKALAQHRVRMFGLAMGPVATRSVVAGGTMTSTTSQGLAYTTPLVGDAVYDTGDEDFYPLTIRSGGMVLGVIGGQRQAFNLDDPKIKQMVAMKARKLYTIVTTFYRVQIDPPQMPRREPLNMDVIERIHKIAPQMFILSPRELGPC